MEDAVVSLEKKVNMGLKATVEIHEQLYRRGLVR